MRKRMVLWTAALAAFVLVAIAGIRSLEAQGPLERPQTWVDCELFDGVVVSASFSPNSDSFDELYAGGDGFLDEVPLISDAGPGDTN